MITYRYAQTSEMIVWVNYREVWNMVIFDFVLGCLMLVLAVGFFAFLSSNARERIISSSFALAAIAAIINGINPDFQFQDLILSLVVFFCFGSIILAFLLPNKPIKRKYMATEKKPETETDKIKIGGF